MATKDMHSPKGEKNKVSHFVLHWKINIIQFRHKTTIYIESEAPLGQILSEAQSSLLFQFRSNSYSCICFCPSKIQSQLDWFFSTNLTVRDAVLVIKNCQCFLLSDKQNLGERKTNPTYEKGEPYTSLLNQMKPTKTSHWVWLQVLLLHICDIFYKIIISSFILEAK